MIISSVAIVLILSLITTKVIIYYPDLKKYSISLFVLLFLIFAYLSHIQANKYKDSNIFWINAYLDAPKYHLTCQGLAKQYLYAGNYQKSKELFYESKKLKNLYDYDLNLATVCIAEGNLNEAENMLLKLLKLKEKLTTLLYLSEIAYVKGETEKSYEYAQRAYKIEKNNVVLLRHMAKLHMDRKEFDKAAEKYKELIKYDGGNKDYYNNLSIAFERSGNKAESLKYTRKAAEFEYINK